MVAGLLKVLALKDLCHSSLLYPVLSVHLLPTQMILPMLFAIRPQVRRPKGFHLLIS